MIQKWNEKMLQNKHFSVHNCYQVSSLIQLLSQYTQYITISLRPTKEHQLANQQLINQRQIQNEWCVVAFLWPERTRSLIIGSRCFDLNEKMGTYHSAASSWVLSPPSFVKTTSLSFSHEEEREIPTRSHRSCF